MRGREVNMGSAGDTVVCRRMLAVALAALLATSCGGGSSAPPEAPGARPNFVWIVADDMSHEIGAYGDPLARTPNLDRLAAEGTRYTNAFATAGVCAPSRAALITGMYATSIGAHHMRSLDGGYQPVPPPEVKTFTEHLRRAGYWTSSSGKTDYQFSGVLDAPLTNWDEPNGDWRGRAEGQPFFAHFTLLTTHESQLFGDPGATETDPGAVSVPAYYPDTPLVRRDFARHYDNVARLDEGVGAILASLEEEGLLEETVVFFFPDNGRGFPRDKRWIYDGGIHEPLIVRWPGRLAPDAVDAQLVSYVDLAPTVLALAGVPVPSYMQGRVFLGPDAEPEPAYVFAAEDRHDEATDRIRAVRDARFKYIRNYQPETPYGQNIAFRNNLATMQEIFRLHDEGLLAAPADWYYRATKPLEELYDVVADPDELENLAGRPEHRDVLERMRAAHEQWVTTSGDLGAVPEADLAERFWPGGVQPRTPRPALSPAGGNFAAQVEVAIAEPVAGASIAYTLEEGERPHWQLYTGPIPIASTATLRVRAVRYGWAESEEVTARFEIRPTPGASP
jgi:N-sulfoglucosamine sulfohydrolase